MYKSSIPISKSKQQAVAVAVLSVYDSRLAFRLWVKNAAILMRRLPWNLLPRSQTADVGIGNWSLPGCGFTSSLPVLPTFEDCVERNCRPSRGETKCFLIGWLHGRERGIGHANTVSSVQVLVSLLDFDAWASVYYSLKGIFSPSDLSELDC